MIVYMISSVAKTCHCEEPPLGGDMAISRYYLTICTAKYRLYRKIPTGLSALGMTTLFTTYFA